MYNLSYLNTIFLDIQNNISSKFLACFEIIIFIFQDKTTRRSENEVFKVQKKWYLELNFIYKFFQISRKVFTFVFVLKVIRIIL